MSYAKAEKVISTLEFEHPVFGSVKRGQKFVVNFREKTSGGADGILYLIDEEGIFGKASEVAFERAPNSPLPSPDKLKNFSFEPMKIPEGLPPDARIFRVKVYIGGEKLLSVKTGDVLLFERTLDDFMRVDLMKNLRTGKVGKYPRDFCIELNTSSEPLKYEKMAVPKYSMNISGCEIKKGSTLGIVEIKNGGNTIKVETQVGEIVHLPSIMFNICAKQKKGEEQEGEEEEEELPIPAQEVEKFRKVENVVNVKRNEMISMMLQIEQLKKQVKSTRREMEVAMQKAKSINPLYTPPSLPGDKLETNEEELECKECFERRVDRVLVCGHAICEHCYLKKLRKSSECPWCKEFLTEAKKLFIEV